MTDALEIMREGQVFNTEVEEIQPEDIEAAVEMYDNLVAFKNMKIPEMYANKHRPENYTEFLCNEYGIAFFTPDKKYGLGYAKGATRNTSFNYLFRNPQECMDHIQSFLNGLTAREERKQERKAERNKPHTLKIDDILYSSWGYDQTNIDFYKIVETTKKSIWIVKISQTTTENTGFMSENVIANPSIVLGEKELHRVNMSGNSPSISFNSYKSAWPWDGKPKGQSHYA